LNRRVPRRIGFVLSLIAGLALLTWLASILVQRTTRGWFDRDLNLRAELAVSGARQALTALWGHPRRDELASLLAEIARDERIMGAAACSPDLQPLAVTPGIPADLSCSSIGAHVQPEDGSAWRTWHAAVAVAGGNVHISAIPVVDGSRVLGFVVLVHDLAFVERREARAQQFLFAAFGVLSFAAAAITLIAVRVAWRGWSRELQRSLQEGARRRDFQPIVKDVQDLVERILGEREADGERGSWTAQRLRQTLERHLEGEKVVIVANREPYIHEREAGGAIAVRHPASGLVTALEPVLRACSGTWIAHGGGSADRETADREGRIRVPPGEESYVLRRIWLSPEEEQGYYYGFANEGLWPLCHIAHARPVFRRQDWDHYRAVNQRFAQAVCEEVDSDDPIVLVQDYHFALAPRLIRQKLPRATVLMFWHVPWPNSQRFGICPWRTELLDGMLGASILGFHTRFDCNCFLESVDSYLEARIDREHNAVVQLGRSTLVRPYPISLEWPSRWVEPDVSAAACRASVLEELGLPPDCALGIGVDRLDYTKGVEERLLAVERLLERFPDLQGRFCFVQLAAPSRTAIESYRQLNAAVEGVAARINARFGRNGFQPIVLLRQHHEPPSVFRYYRAADVCYVSSLHDGMNLVAKEFVASRDDERGVLVLSQFTGSARELTEALIVNPYDLDEASSALAAALSMPLEEQRERMRAMRALLAEFNVYRWAGRMLLDAARLRDRERLMGRLSAPLAPIAGGKS
jgi:trehalose 6-phosphate synthase